MKETTQGILLTYLFDSFEVGNVKQNDRLKNASRKKMMAMLNQDLVDLEELELDILSDYQSAYEDLFQLTDDDYLKGRDEILSWEPTNESIR